jgi:uncharacterized protein with PQ loop repeat
MARIEEAAGNPQGRPRPYRHHGTGRRDDTVVAELLAWCGAALSCLLCLPQALRTLRLAGRLDGVSAGTYWIVLANAMVWVSWCLLTGEFAVGAPALVNGPAAVLILRRLAAASAQKQCLDEPRPAAPSGPRDSMPAG